MGLDNTNCVVEISKDKMQALLTLTDASALVDLDERQVASHILAAGVSHGLDSSSVARICAAKRLNNPEIVARGTAPVDGKDEEIVYRFHIGLNTTPVEGEDGAVDFRNIENFNNTPAGTVVAEKSVPAAGRPGVNVCGEEIPCRSGRSVQFKTGKGAEVSADGNFVLAAVSGHACLIAERITVMETIEVPAHVDFSIGNIHFIGNVRIRGGVHPGFSVEAQGNVEINDNVEKANVVAGGNLTIRGIVFGQGDCLIRSGGNAHIGAVDQAQIEVQGNLTVENYLRHSHTLVGGLLELTGQKGNIVAGETWAFRGVNSPFIGNSMATLTKITVGTNPFGSRANAEIEAGIAELEGKLAQLNNGITMLQNRRAITQQLDPASSEMLTKLSQGRTQLDQQIAEQKARLEALRMQNEFRDARIRISQTIFPGVLINFRGRLQYKSNDPAQHITFYEEGAEVHSGPY